MSHVTNIALQVYQISRVVIGKFHQQSKLYLIQNIYRHCPCEYKMLPLRTYYCCENKWHDRIMWDVYISCENKWLWDVYMFFLVNYAQQKDWSPEMIWSKLQLIFFGFQCVLKYESQN